MGEVQLGTRRIHSMEQIRPHEEEALVGEAHRANPSAPNPRTRPRQQTQMKDLVLFTLVTGTGGFLFGYDTGVIGGALPFVRDDMPEVGASTFLQGFIVSGAVLGAVVGAMVAGWLADRYGRRVCLMWSDVVFALGAVLMATAPDPELLILGRLVVGLGVGVASMCVPIYIAEAAPAESRASLVSVNNLLITFGQFMAFVVNSLLRDFPHQWRIMLGVCGIPSIFQLAGLAFLPESPRWLVNKGRREEAREALQKLRKSQASSEVEVELEELIRHRGSKEPGKEWQMLRKRRVQRQLGIGVGLQILQQMAGINTVMYYTPIILEYAGYGTSRAVLLSLLPAAVNMLGSLLGVFLIERCGRRVLLLTSLAGVFAALLLLGQTFNLETHGGQIEVTTSEQTPRSELCPSLQPHADGHPVLCHECFAAGCGVCTATSHGSPLSHFQFWFHILNGRAENVTGHIHAMCYTNSSASTCTGVMIDQGVSRKLAWHDSTCPNIYGQLSLGALLLYLAAFSPGLSPVPWAVNAEIYHQGVRGIAVGAATTANWVANFIVSQTFLELVVWMGVGYTFWLFAGVAALGFVVYYVVLPETKGLSLEEVQELFPH